MGRSREAERMAERLRLAIAELRLGRGTSVSDMWFPGKSLPELEDMYARILIAAIRELI